ncbi:MAG: hypothetical protein WCB12_20095 [Bryobacteraceae bacterium]
MVRFGLCTEEQYLRAGERRHYLGAHVAYSLLDVGESPSEEQIRAFEDISFTLRTSNGTFRTTFRQRFQDVDAAAMKWMEQFYAADSEVEIQDRAVSHGLTSWEWAACVFQKFPRAKFEASDVLIELIELSRAGEAYIVEPSGRPLQYVKPPFAVSLAHPEPRRYPINRLVALRARRRFAKLDLGQNWIETAAERGWRVRRISCVHPLARELARRNASFQFRLRSVFDQTSGTCDVLRTMNILNRSYFRAEDLARGASAAFQSLRPAGIWIVGRTSEEDLKNHVSLLRRSDRGWKLLERIGSGSEIEELALGGAGA